MKHKKKEHKKDEDKKTLINKGIEFKSIDYLIFDYQFSRIMTIVYKARNNLLYLVCSHRNNIVSVYNIETKNKILEIKFPQDKSINKLEHYFDGKKKTDYILATESNGLYLFDAHDWNRILSIDIKNILKKLETKILHYKNENYIVVIPFHSYMRIYDFKGNKKKIIKIINRIDDRFYMYKDLNKTYFVYLEQGKNVLTSYDFNKDKIYKHYYKANVFLKYLIVNKAKKITQLISVNISDIIVWDFHTKQYLYNLCFGISIINDICLCDEQYLFIASRDAFIANSKDIIKIIDLNNQTVKGLNTNCDKILTINKINHQKFKGCFISVCLSKKTPQIKLWIKS